MENFKDKFFYSVMFLFIGLAIGMSLQYLSYKHEEAVTREEILAMDPADVIDLYFPNLWETIEQTSDELSRDLAKIAVLEFTGYLQEGIRQGTLNIIPGDNSRIPTQNRVPGVGSPKD
jgi:hypothetical protein